MNNCSAKSTLKYIFYAISIEKVSSCDELNSWSRVNCFDMFSRKKSSATRDQNWNALKLERARIDKTLACRWKIQLSRWRLSIVADYWYYYPLELFSSEFLPLSYKTYANERIELNLISSQSLSSQKWIDFIRISKVISLVYCHQTSPISSRIDRKN